jgi:hypothetical protein
MAGEEPLAANGWNDLVKVAIVGTARLAGRFAEGEPAAVVGGAGLTGVLAAVQPAPERSPERGVLAAAATLGVARRAGALGVAAPELPEPASVLDGQPAPRELARMMPVLLADRNRAVMIEVVERCAALDVRVPASALPALLDLASSQGAGAEELRAALPVAGGARGRWLAARSPRWAWMLTVPALTDDPESAWDVSSAEDRLGLLRALRAAGSPTAVGLLSRTWRSDRAPERAVFVAALADGLSLRDEPFLEEVALVDRAREVRQAAWRLLDRLPESRRARRMPARAEQMIEVLQHDGVVPELPADWIADGIRLDKGSIKAIAAQVVEATPLTHWGPDVPAAIRRVAGANGKVVVEVFAALGRAALHQGRDDWTLALLTFGGRDHVSRSLLRTAPVPHGATWLAGVLAKGSVLDASVALGLAHEVPRPWPAALVAEVLRRGVDVLSHGRHIPGDVTPHLHLVGERADPALLSRLVPDLAALRTTDVRLERAFRDAHTTAHLRLTALALLGGC